MCRAPKAPMVFSTSAMMSSSRATSVCTNKAFPPAEVISRATSSPSATRRPETTTIAPSLANARGSGFADAGGAFGDEDSLVLEGFHSWPQRRIGRFGTRIVFNLEIQNLDQGV